MPKLEGRHGNLDTISCACSVESPLRPAIETRLSLIGWNASTTSVIGLVHLGLCLPRASRIVLFKTRA